MPPPAPPSFSIPGPNEGLIPAGYPRTPHGAVAQMAAIAALALKDLNPSNPRAAYEWAALGAVPFCAVDPTGGRIGHPHGCRGFARVHAAHLLVTLTHAQTKGALDDGDFVVACVLGEFDANYRSTVRAGVGDCQRIVWQGGRWWIGPRAQPAYAPSTWPGAGLRPLTRP